MSEGTKVTVKLSEEQELRLVESIYESGMTVTPADVARVTGISTVSAQANLTRLAGECEAHLLVDKNGEVAYRFEKGFEQRRRASGLWQALLRAYSAYLRGWELLFKGLFGLTMLASAALLAVPCLILYAVTLYLTHGDDPASRWRRGDFMALLNPGTWLFLFGWTKDTERKVGDRSARSNILLDCHSFVFGDGDANFDLEDRMYQEIAQLIQRNKGVIVAEQLSPYIGRPATDDDMIPVLVRFDGEPHVTDAGNLVYVFKSLMVSSSQEAVQKAESGSHYLKERFWGLTGISWRSRFTILGLSLFNTFVSTVALVSFAKTFIVLFVVLLPVIWILEFFHLLAPGTIVFDGTFVVVGLAVSALLFSYFLFFLLFPVGRLLANLVRNAGVFYRNTQRRQFARQLAEGRTTASPKLIEARSYTVSLKQVTSEPELAFDSSKDSLEQEFAD